MFEKKIVITGMGCVSPLGSDIHKALSALSEGRSGIKLSDDQRYCHYCANVSDYEPTKHVPAKLLRRMERVNHFALNAVGDALAMANLNDETMLEDTGVLVGTGYAGIESVVNHQKSLHDDGIQMLRPIHFPTTVYNATAGLISIQFKTKGINSTLTGLDMPAEYALLYACMILQRQPDAKIVVVGADSCTEHLQQGIYRLGFLSSDTSGEPKKAFEKGNDGIIMGEGAGAIVLETEQAARARGVVPLAEIRNVVQRSSSADPFGYDTNPSAALGAIDSLITSLGSPLDSYNLISLSANGSPVLDKLESAMLQNLQVDTVPCRALSDYIGTFPGSGILRLILGLSSLKNGKNIKPLPTKTLNQEMETRLTLDVKKGKHYLHLVNGLGGHAIAIDLEVLSP